MKPTKSLSSATRRHFSRLVLPIVSSLLRLTLALFPRENFVRRRLFVSITELFQNNYTIKTIPGICSWYFLFFSLKPNLSKTLNSRKIWEKSSLPWISGKYYFCYFSLIKSKFNKKDSMDSLFLYLRKKPFIQLKTSIFSSKKSKFWFVASIGTHISPITMLDIGKICKKEYLGGLVD